MTLPETGAVGKLISVLVLPADSQLYSKCDWVSCCWATQAIKWTITTRVWDVELPATDFEGCPPCCRGIREGCRVTGSLLHFISTVLYRVFLVLLYFSVFAGDGLYCIIAPSWNPKEPFQNDYSERIQY